MARDRASGEDLIEGSGSTTFMTAVLSYNRGELLANCVRSIEEFSPPTTIVVFDDRSDDTRTTAELERISGRGHEVIVSPEPSSARYGNLYRNLDAAMRLARERGFDLVHLVEDDMQLVWRYPSLADHVATVFAAFPVAVQVNALFWKFATKAAGALAPAEKAYRMGQSPACGVGFVDVRRLDERGFRHQRDELESVRHSATLGLELLSLAYPVVARIPWPRYSRHRIVRGDEIGGRRPYLLKPLSEADLRRLLERDLSQPPYAEHYCVPWGWRCWQPYGWTASYATWLKTLAIVARHRRSVRGLIPRRVGSFDELAP